MTINELQDQSTSCTIELARIARATTAELQKTVQDKTALQAEINELKASLDWKSFVSLSVKHDNLRSQNDSLKSQHAAVSQDLETAKAEIERMKTSVSWKGYLKLVDEKTELRSIIGQLERQHADALNEIERLNAVMARKRVAVEQIVDVLTRLRYAICVDRCSNIRFSEGKDTSHGVRCQEASRLIETLSAK